MEQNNEPPVQMLLFFQPEAPGTQTQSELVRLMSRVSKSHPLHKIINADSGKIREKFHAVPDLLRILNRSPEDSWRERKIAAIALRHVEILPEEECDAAVALGNALHSNYDSQASIAAQRFGMAIFRSIVWVAGLFLLLMALAILIFLLHSLSFLLMLAILIGMFLFVLFLCTPFVFLGSPIYDFVHTADVREAAMKSLRKLQLPRSVGALAKAARGEGNIACEGRLALHSLLPRLSARHYGMLGSDATPELCALLLTRDVEAMLNEKILTALEKIGDGRAANAVQRFIHTTNIPHLREKARSIEGILLERRENENHASMLLRGSSAPVAHESQLLRASYPASDAAPEQLLRPTSGTPDEA